MSQSLDAGSVAALPEGLRVELEGIEDAGGVRFLQEMAAQIRVRGPVHWRLSAAPSANSVHDALLRA